MTSTTIACVLPREARRSVPLTTVVHELAVALDMSRHGDLSPTTAIKKFLAAYSIQLPGGRTIESVADEIMLRIFADEVYDSEQAQAERAAAAVLYALFDASTIDITGWMRGQRVTHGYETFVLTGSTCERCETNPECYGATGSGVRCLDTAGCGWSFCF